MLLLREIQNLQIMSLNTISPERLTVSSQPNQWYFDIYQQHPKIETSYMSRMDQMTEESNYQNIDHESSCVTIRSSGFNLHNGSCRCRRDRYI